MDEQSLDIARLPRRAGDPDVQTSLQRRLWSERGLADPVPPCPYPAAELERLTEQGRRVAYLPPALAGHCNRQKLAATFPLLRSFALVPGNVVLNDVDAAGWFDYESCIDAPYLEADEAEMRTWIARDGRVLLTLEQYVVAAQDTRHIDGHYLDERRTWARVGSRIEGGTVAVRFDGSEMAEGLGDEAPADGCLLVSWDVGPTDAGRMLGARTTSAARFGSEPDLDAERERQVERYLKAGFAERLELTAEEYRRSLPMFAPRPADYVGRFSRPLLVDPRIPWREQAERLSIVLSSGSLRGDYLPHDSAVARPEQPYAAWFCSWGERFPAPTAPATARVELAADEVGAGVLELVAMEGAYPEFTRSGRFFEAVGDIARYPDKVVTTDTPLRGPCMYEWRGVPELGANLHPRAFAVCRPLVRGATINFE